MSISGGCRPNGLVAMRSNTKGEGCRIELQPQQYNSLVRNAIAFHPLRRSPFQPTSSPGNPLNRLEMMEIAVFRS